MLNPLPDRYFRYWQRTANNAANNDNNAIPLVAGSKTVRNCLLLTAAPVSLPIWEMTPLTLCKPYVPPAW